MARFARRALDRGLERTDSLVEPPLRSQQCRPFREQIRVLAKARFRSFQLGDGFVQAPLRAQREGEQRVRGGAVREATRVLAGQCLRGSGLSGSRQGRNRRRVAVVSSLERGESR